MEEKEGRVVRRPGATILPPGPPNAAELRNDPIFMKLTIFIQNLA